MSSTTNQPPDSHRPLLGKVALITGASRGIGAAIAENLASKGAKLILNYKSQSSTKIIGELSSTLTATYGIPHLVIQADMGSSTGPEDLVKIAGSKIPDLKLDIIINNAGVGGASKIEDCDVEAFQLLYSVNVRGPLLLMKAAIPYLPHDRSGRVINISSIASTGGYIYSSIYSGTKAALESMTRTWARELASRATVNAVNPGPVITGMWEKATDEYMKYLKPFVMVAPLSQIREKIDNEVAIKEAEVLGGRAAYPEEIAGIVSMLVSSESGWCTGQVICANGGMRMAA